MIVLIYALLSFAALWIAVVSTKRYSGSRGRRAFLSSIAAICFAPSYIGGGHGYAVGPAWIAALQQLFMEGGSRSGFWVVGIAPIVGMAVVCWIVSEVWITVVKRRNVRESDRR